MEVNSFTRQIYWTLHTSKNSVYEELFFPSIKDYPRLKYLIGCKSFSHVTVNFDECIRHLNYFVNDVLNKNDSSVRDVC